MTERIDDILSNGATFPAATVPSGGFNVGNLWDGYYNFKAVGGKLKDVDGHIPIPTQPKIDRWQKAVGYLVVELEAATEAERKARQALAEADAEKSVEELKAEVDKAVAEGNEVADKFRDALADVCSGNPTRAQLGHLPTPLLFQFVTHVGELLNPNV
jgi:hypothetical protein